MSTDSSSVSLTVKLEASSEKPGSINSVDKFKCDFDELWQEAITPAISWIGVIEITRKLAK